MGYPVERHRVTYYCCTQAIVDALNWVPALKGTAQTRDHELTLISTRFRKGSVFFGGYLGHMDWLVEGRVMIGRISRSAAEILCGFIAVRVSLSIVPVE